MDRLSCALFLSSSSPSPFVLGGMLVVFMSEGQSVQRNYEDYHALEIDIYIPTVHTSFYMLLTYCKKTNMMGKI